VEENGEGISITAKGKTGMGKDEGIVGEREGDAGLIEGRQKEGKGERGSDGDKER